MDGRTDGRTNGRMDGRTTDARTCGVDAKRAHRRRQRERETEEGEGTDEREEEGQGYERRRERGGDRSSIVLRFRRTRSSAGAFLASQLGCQTVLDAHARSECM